MKAASSAEHMKVLAGESSNADSYFQQLDKLRMIYEEYIKISKETIPNAEKELRQLNEELDQKTQALDDVIINPHTYGFWLIGVSTEMLLNSVECIWTFYFYLLPSST